MFLFRRVRATSLPPLGSGFRRLWTASALTNLGDGAVLAAGPLLVASLSTSATAVATAVVTVRQRLTPEHVLGRVGSAYRLADLGGAAFGGLAGGLLADGFGLLAPFWVAATALGGLTVAAWKPLLITERSSI